MQIGFIGLGNMGFPMARRLIGEGHDVVAFDTNSAALRVYRKLKGSWSFWLPSSLSRARSAPPWKP